MSLTNKLDNCILTAQAILFMRVGGRIGDAEKRWITTESGSHIQLDENGTIIAGAGGKFNGKKLSDMGGTKKFTKYQTNNDFKPTHESATGEPLQHIEGNTYLDSEGFEVEDDYATALNPTKREDKPVLQDNSKFIELDGEMQRVDFKQKGHSKGAEKKVNLKNKLKVLGETNKAYKVENPNFDGIHSYGALEQMQYGSYAMYKKMNEYLFLPKSHAKAENGVITETTEWLKNNRSLN